MNSGSKTVYVAMSGGVDSSVAAALLKRRGFNVVGVFFKPWSPFGRSPVGGQCLWQKDREDAMRTAAVIGIPLLTWDFSKEYEKNVTKYMIDAYRRGITPNPDVMCNQEIKFGSFFSKALNNGADYIATGHYARIKKSKIKNQKSKLLYKFLQGKDKNKDQSYFLWTLGQKELSKTLFPIGEYTKPEVRKLAKKFGLPNHAKKDSQGVCFIGPLDMKSFLKNYIKPKKGHVLHIDGRMLGEHDGTYYYTIGQRHGLNISIGGGPYYVVTKDLRKNIVYVGPEKDLLTAQAKISNLSFTYNGKVWPLKVETKIRYRSKSEKAILQEDGTLKFIKPQRAITPGQSAVFYKGNELIGGGIIK